MRVDMHDLIAVDRRAVTAGGTQREGNEQQRGTEKFYQRRRQSAESAGRSDKHHPKHNGTSWFRVS